MCVCEREREREREREKGGGVLESDLFIYILKNITLSVAYATN